MACIHRAQSAGVVCAEKESSSGARGQMRGKRQKGIYMYDGGCDTSTVTTRTLAGAVLCGRGGAQREESSACGRRVNTAGGGRRGQTSRSVGGVDKKKGGALMMR